MLPWKCMVWETVSIEKLPKLSTSYFSHDHIFHTSHAAWIAQDSILTLTKNNHLLIYKLYGSILIMITFIIHFEIYIFYTRSLYTLNCCQPYQHQPVQSEPLHLSSPIKNCLQCLNILRIPFFFLVEGKLILNAN